MLFSGSIVSVGGHIPPHFVCLQLMESGGQSAAVTQPKILVVDDERLLADTTAAILGRAGYDTRTAYDAFGALETMAAFHPDYVLTDVMMPVMNGVELAITIRKTYPAARILLFSGQAGISKILEESKANGFEFPLLAKPVHPAKLIEGLKMLHNS